MFWEKKLGYCKQYPSKYFTRLNDNDSPNAVNFVYGLLHGFYVLVGGAGGEGEKGACVVAARFVRKMLDVDAKEFLELADGDKKTLSYLVKAARIIEKINMQLDSHHNLPFLKYLEEIAKKIIAQNPDKEEYVCAAGVSPSGSVHIGNFRDLATPLFVVKALEKKGKKARLLISWDEFDRCRKIPANVQAVVGSDYDKYIGCPYVDIPDPWGCHENYAKHFEEEFLGAMEKFGIELDCRYQADMYRSGKYVEHILTALEKRGEIFDILAYLYYSP